jgi:hypothetical protein
MKVKFTERCRVAVDHALDPNRNGYFSVAVAAGDVMDVPDSHADSLIGSRMAVEADPLAAVTVDATKVVRA